MTTSESLFDNNINSEQPAVSKTPSHHLEESEAETDDNYDLDLGKTLITYRILVSRREAGAIIGKEGVNISKIRDEFDVKAGVSKVMDGCIDRILTVTGMVDNIPSALVDIAQSVTDANIQTIKEADENSSNPLRLISYEYPPLRPLTQRPNYRSPEYETNLFLRLLIPNSQVGTLIGKGGLRIKSIQEDNDIKMVASKDFLEHSTERLVELQGSEENLKDALLSISKYLLRDYQGTAPTTFYVPCAPLENNSAASGDIRTGGKEIIKKISFPNEYIGALIGKRGSRIQEIRLLSQCAVAIENENTEDDEREITLVGTKASVDKAIDLLNMYYEREQKRRMSE
ncbi:hypothetical protein PICMEDRAFT_30906 [Pichia membranifaciens NRRL Y-2026]|uniref:K Homology domain-containing protein n=1 Tax=Pichia membranifaciens NRRL Y-2026 TaxID=763406 RepID=A0A1E3NNS3_9ASCO|nr:hypothetical protein PICMEDRAFT_30906 [Pichia membranifaciens NRRL Y-2026]ODQ47183.1 hypothetical protein PICMEDRAFT_30906 [Pichia membranifaciens NRRL Y-2026]